MGLAPQAALARGFAFEGRGYEGDSDPYVKLHKGRYVNFSVMCIWRIHFRAFLIFSLGSIW
jgi:hypothetical protein